MNDQTRRSMGMKGDIEMKGAGTAVVVVGGVAFLALSVAWLGKRKDSDALVRESTAILAADSKRPDSGQEPVTGEQAQSYGTTLSSRVSPLALEGEHGFRGEVTETPNAEPPAYAAEQEAELREQYLAMLRLIYEDVASVAQLSKEEETSLIELLYKQQTESFDSNVEPLTLDGAAAYRDRLARHRAEISALLGSSKADAVVEYQRSMDARSQVEDLRRQLELAGMPITEEQRKGKD